MSKQAIIMLRTAKGASVAMAFSVAAVFVLFILFDIPQGGHVSSVQATSTATTTVTVLNRPPSWIVTAREQVASATTSPTNSGGTVTWTATGFDNNNESYYLLICKSSSTPVFVTSSYECGGTGSWAKSAVTASNVAAVVSTTTADSGWNEKNDWYGYICDVNSNPPDSKCSTQQFNGLHEAGPASATSSPFVVNHRPTFTWAADNSPALPGQVVTWTTTATDTVDVIRGGDNLRLFVCKANDFNPTIPSCGVGGGWATSSFTTLGNPSTSTTLAIPLQDRDHDAYVYIIDEFNHPATGGWHASSTVLSVQNAAPYIASSTIQVFDVYGTSTNDQNLVLTTPEGLTQNFVVEFQVTDDNSCAAYPTGNEIADVDINVFRYSGADPYGLLCDSTNEFNANYCYTHTATSTWWTPTCYQVPGDCTGASQASVWWECTFPLWYVADPTDGGSQYPGHDWRASSRATDEALTGNYSTYNGAIDAAGSANMTQFLSFRATGSPIAYGSWEPGQDTNVHPATTTVYATGNTGLNHYLSGDAMCVTYPTCTGYSTSTIYVPYQHYSLTNTTDYDLGTPLSTSTAPVLVDVLIGKTQATSSPANDDTYWGIGVPDTITYAGPYVGRNYIDVALAPFGEW